MKIRPLAICTADFPDDSVATADGKGFLDHGGRNVAEAIAEILSGLGCATAPPENAAEYGWRFDWSIEGQSFLCQVSSIPPEFYLHFEGAALGKDVPPKNHRTAEIFVALNAELARDGRFHDVRWYPLVGGTVRLEDEVAAKDPLAPIASPPIAEPPRTSRPIMFLAGWVGLLATLAALSLRQPTIALVGFVVSALFLVVGGRGIGGQRMRPPNGATARAEQDAGPR